VNLQVNLQFIIPSGFAPMMGAIELAIEKRKEHIDGVERPLHTTERTVNEQVENCYYCNIPRRVAERMDLDGGVTVKVDEYHDKVVIRRAQPQEED